MDRLPAPGEVVLGGAFSTAPWWLHYLVEINIVLATITGVCGAIIAVHGAYRLVRGWTRHWFG